MKIEQIKLKNYRQYRDTTIVLATSENQNLTVLQGANGAGKTNLLNAVTWCLYGKERHLDKKYGGFPLVNTATLRKLEPGERCRVEVKILMRDKDNKKITVERIQKFQKLKGEKLQEIGNPKFRMWRQVNGEIVRSEDPEYALSGLIPESIEEYFFFDGERLNDYFRSASGGKIKKAVFKISQLGLLENAIRHLKNKKNDFLKREKGLSSKAKEIGDELSESEELLKEYKQELNGQKEQKKEAEEKEDGYSDKLRTSSVANVEELENERNELKEELEELETSIDTLEQEQSDYLIKMTPMIFAYNPIIKMKKMIEKGEEAGDIPPDYKKSFLEKLLKKGECICGADISEENRAREKIKRLLQECKDISDISGELIEEHASLRLMIEELKGFRGKQILYGKDVRKLYRERQKKRERLEKISEKLRSSDSEQIKRWEQRLANYKKVKEGLIEKIAELNFHIQETKKKIESLTSELDRELKKERKYEKLRKNLSFCNESLRALERIKSEIMEDVRKEIEEKTKSQFFGLIWKKETYKDVQINGEYIISIVDQYGMEGIGTLSAGERQVLALSFIAALNSVSGFDAPIIIDTPLGRISKEPKKNIAHNLSNYLKGKQVTLLVTEEEYTPEVREKLSKRVGKEYIINFKETKEGAEAEAIPYSIWEYAK